MNSTRTNIVYPKGNKPTIPCDINTSHHIASHGVNDRVCCCLNVARVAEYDLRRLLTSLPPPLPVPETLATSNRSDCHCRIITGLFTVVVAFVTLSYGTYLHLRLHIHTYLYAYAEIALFSTLSRFNCLSSCEISPTAVHTVVVIKQIHKCSRIDNRKCAMDK